MKGEDVVLAETMAKLDAAAEKESLRLLDHSAGLIEKRNVSRPLSNIYLNNLQINK